VDPPHRSAGFIGQHAPLTETEWNWPQLRAVALREAQRVLGRSDAAQDAAQETLLRAWRHAGRCRSPDRPEPWLRAIARREALRIVTGAPPADPLDGLEPLVQDHAEAAARRTDVARAVRSLPPHERYVLARHYWRDMSCEEIARDLACPTGTVKIRLHRARKKLAPRLG
jgi:RNA polymerase sigma-70 factor (ECF subfamily)